MERSLLTAVQHARGGRCGRAAFETLFRAARLLNRETRAEAGAIGRGPCACALSESEPLDVDDQGGAYFVHGQEVWRVATRDSCARALVGRFVGVVFEERCAACVLDGVAAVAGVLGGSCAAAGRAALYRVSACAPPELLALGPPSAEYVGLRVVALSLVDGERALLACRDRVGHVLLLRRGRQLVPTTFKPGYPPSLYESWGRMCAQSVEATEFAELRAGSATVSFHMPRIGYDETLYPYDSTFKVAAHPRRGPAPDLFVSDATSDWPRNMRALRIQPFLGVAVFGKTELKLLRTEEGRVIAKEGVIVGGQDARVLEITRFSPSQRFMVVRVVTAQAAKRWAVLDLAALPGWTD